MISLPEKILYMYPEANFDPLTGNVIIEDDGGGPKITKWLLDSPQPSPADLAAVADAAATAAAWTAIRAERDLLLAACDWRVLPDAPVDVAGWLTYRQKLRDLPQTYPDPAAVVWPTPPPD